MPVCRSVGRHAKALRDHRVEAAAVERTQPVELRLDIIAHIVRQPLDDLAIAFALPETDQDILILFADRHIAVGGRHVGLDCVAADLHQIERDGVVADRAVHMHNGPPVFRHELDGGMQAGRRGFRIGVFLNDAVRPLGDDLGRKGGDVGKVVIERVAVDPAVLHDGLDSDLTERTLIQELQKRVFDGLLGVRGHIRPPAPQCETAYEKRVLRYY